MACHSTADRQTTPLPVRHFFPTTSRHSSIPLRRTYAERSGVTLQNIRKKTKDIEYLLREATWQLVFSATEFERA
jgi:hypothetical protein